MASLFGSNGTVASAPGRPRADRNFHLAVALTVMLIVGIGFGRTVNANLFHPPSPRPWILHLHVALFTGWVLLYGTQAVLVRSRRVAWHRRLGGWLMPDDAWYVGVDALLLAAAARDWIVMRGVHAVYLYGLPALALGQAATMWIYRSRAPAWVAIAHALLR
jgi:hypothetical protein